MMKMLRTIAAFLVLSWPAYAQVPGQLASGTLLGNASAARAPGTQTTPSALIDRAISSTQGAMLYRNATIWTALTPGTAGLPLLSGGVAANLAYGQLNLAAAVTGILPLANGGTSANLTASNGGVFYSTGSAGAILSGTATARQMLQSGASTTPAWSTTTWPATTTINRLLWSSAANVISDLATANNGILATGGGGIPAIVSTLPCLNFPALTGDVTAVANACATVLATAQPAVHTWALAQTFTTAPVFTDGPGSRTALGLGSASNVAHSTLALGGCTIGADTLCTSGNITSGGNVAALGAGSILWTGRTLMQSPSDGVMTLFNSTGTTFSRLQFGGTSASFPSLRRTSTALNVRLADDSGDAPLTAGATTITGSFTATGLVTNASLANMGANTIKGSVAGGTPADLTASQAQGILEQGYVLLNVATASAVATLDDTSSFTSTYDDYLILIDNFVPATNNVAAWLRIQSGGTFQTTTYLNASTETTAVDLGNGAVNLGNTAGKGYSVGLTLHNINSTSVNKFVTGIGAFYSGSATIGTILAIGFWNGGQGAVTGIRLMFSTGNISTGSMKIYGKRKAL